MLHLNLHLHPTIEADARNTVGSDAVCLVTSDRPVSYAHGNAGATDRVADQDMQRARGH